MENLSGSVGFRDEYHGQQCSSLAVMGGDGSELHLIAVNPGRDCEPTVMPDGRILFNRLDVFYNLTKAEMSIQCVFPDGTGNVTLHGPERRAFWAEQFGPMITASGSTARMAWTVRLQLSKN